MATARETLVEEILALVASKPDNIAQDIEDLLKRYRVQTKPRTEIPEGMTARDALADRLVAMWRQGVLGDATQLGNLIDTFRMQHKKTGGAPKNLPVKRCGHVKASCLSSSVLVSRPMCLPPNSSLPSRLRKKGSAPGGPYHHPWQAALKSKRRPAANAPNVTAKAWYWHVPTQGTIIFLVSIVVGKGTNRSKNLISVYRWPPNFWGKKAPETNNA